MANYATLKSAIQQVVKTNGNEEITGALLQQSLLAMINSLGAGYQFVGVADTTTVPGTPDQNVFYIASESGTYSNFGGLSVSDGEVAIFKYNGTWTKEVTGAATVAQLTQLGQEVGKYALVFTGTPYYYINTGVGVGSTVNLTPVKSSSIAWKSYIEDVSEGDVVIVNGVGGDSARLWAFLDSSNVIISVADASATATNLELTAPSNAEKIVINDQSDAISYLIRKDSTEGRLSREIEDVKESIGSEVSNNEIDFSISDESNHDILQVVGGYVKTKNFDSRYNVTLNNDEICDYFAINSSGEYVADSNFGCSRFIDCIGGGSIKITLPVTTSATGRGLAFYDSNKTFITGSFRECSTGSSNGIETMTIKVPATARYFRVTYWNFANSVTYGKFSCEITYPIGFLGHGKSRPYQSGNIYFSVEVDQAIEDWESTAQTTDKTTDMKKTTGVLLLPESYSKTGKKTPLIMYCHGLSHGVYYGKWGTTTAFMTQKEHFIAQGYAVFDCNGAKDTNKLANGKNCFLSSIPNVNAYYRAYKYIVENYNVDDKIYVIGGSMGGLVATQFCLTFGNIVRAFAILSGYTSLYSWWSAPNPAGADVYPAYFGITGEDKTYQTNIEKLRGHAPELRMFDISGTTHYNGMQCPVHAWIGSNDASVNIQPQLDNFISALRNSGKEAVIRKPNGLGHEIVSGAILSIDNEVCLWFNNYR